jgi:general secretion pathway protein G
MRREKGFTLIELLIVVAIIGIIAAIAIPNLLNAIDRGKQKRTMADIRSIGTAVESYAVDNNRYPNFGTNALGPAMGTAGLAPIYIKVMPTKDGWNNDWHGDCNTPFAQYTLESYAKDNANGTDVAGQTADFNCDLVFANGQFFAWPQGTQT